MDSKHRFKACKNQQPTTTNHRLKTNNDPSSNLGWGVFYWLLVVGLWLVVWVCWSIILAPRYKAKDHRRFWSRNVNRNFSERELEKFFSVIGNEKHLTCFKLQAYLGLRISEAAKVNISDIDFSRKKIRVYKNFIFL